MLLRFFVLFAAFIGGLSPAPAQGVVLTGRVVAAGTRRPIPFANLGIAGKNLGTAATENGNFSLRLAAAQAGDTLTCSAIGYETQAVAIAQLAAGAPLIFSLTEKTSSLPEVVVQARATRVRRIGTTTHNPLLWGSVQQKQTHDRVEFAKLIPLHDQPAELLQAHIFLRQPTVDTVTLRLNFYGAGLDRPAGRLVERAVLVRAAVQNGWLTIDLTKYALVLTRDFYLGFEFLPVRQSPVPAFSYGAQFGGVALVRTSSLGTWRREPGATLAAYLTVRQ